MDKDTRDSHVATSGDTLLQLPPLGHVMSAEETLGKMFVLAQLCGATVQLGRQKLLLGPIIPSYSSSSYSGMEGRKKTHTFILRTVKQINVLIIIKPSFQQGGAIESKLSFLSLPYMYNIEQD